MGTFYKSTGLDSNKAHVMKDEKSRRYSPGIRTTAILRTAGQRGAWPSAGWRQVSANPLGCEDRLWPHACPCSERLRGVAKSAPHSDVAQRERRVALVATWQNGQRRTEVKVTEVAPAPCFQLYSKILKSSRCSFINLVRSNINSLQVTCSFIFAHFHISENSTMYILRENCRAGSEAGRHTACPACGSTRGDPGAVPGAPHRAHVTPHLRADQAFISFSQVTKPSRASLRTVRGHSLGERQNSLHAQAARARGPSTSHAAEAGRSPRHMRHTVPRREFKTK